MEGGLITPPALIGTGPQMGVTSQERSRAEPRPTSRCLICLIQVSCLVQLQFSYKRKETKALARIDKFLVASSLNDVKAFASLCAQIEMQPYGD
jgi:hypothetical protein